MCRLVIFSICYFLFDCLLAQDVVPIGARANGIGNTTVTVADEWAPFHNIAGIVTDKKMSVSLWYKSSYGLAVMKQSAFSCVRKINKGAVSVSFYRFGNELYSLTKVAIGYAHKIDRVQLGMQLQYNQAYIQQLATEQALVLDAGGIVELIPSTLFLGASVFNITQSERGDELLSVVMKAGLSYRLQSKLMLNGEIEKDIRYTKTVKVGIEYKPIERFYLRTGFTTYPFQHDAGVGFRTTTIQVDYALSNHKQLGFSHSMSLVLFFNRQK